jgi:hypothetical protein
MAYLTDQGKQEKAKTGRVALGIGIGSILGFGIGIMISPKSGSGMSSKNMSNLNSQTTEFAQEYGSGGQNSVSLEGSRIGSSSNIGQGNSIIGNMNPAGKKTKIFATGGEYGAGNKTGRKAGESNIGTIYSMDNESYNDAVDERNYTQPRKSAGGHGRSSTEFVQDYYSIGHGGVRPGGSNSPKQFSGSYESSLNYGLSNIQADSIAERGQSGTVSQSEAKSLDTSNAGSQANGMRAEPADEFRLKDAITSPFNTTGTSSKASALKRSARASLKNKGGK